MADAGIPYWLYLLECEGERYYAGIAVDVEQRYFQHLFGRGAKFTRAWPPRRVLAARSYPSKGAALRAELELKALPRAAKLAFFAARAVQAVQCADARDDHHHADLQAVPVAAQPRP